MNTLFVAYGPNDIIFEFDPIKDYVENKLLTYLEYWIKWLNANFSGSYRLSKNKDKWTIEHSTNLIDYAPYEIYEIRNSNAFDFICETKFGKNIHINGNGEEYSNLIRKRNDIANRIITMIK